MADDGVQLVVVRLYPTQRNCQPEEQDQDGQEHRRHHPARAEQQPQDRLEAPVGHRITSQAMNADTTASPRYCEAITSAAGSRPPTRITVAAGMIRPATGTILVVTTCRPPGPRTTIACGVSANQVTVCNTTKASATTFTTTTIGEPA